MVAHFHGVARLKHSDDIYFLEVKLPSEKPASEMARDKNREEEDATVARISRIFDSGSEKGVF